MYMFIHKIRLACIVAQSCRLSLGRYQLFCCSAVSHIGLVVLCKLCVSLHYSTCCTYLLSRSHDNCHICLFKVMIHVHVRTGYTSVTWMVCLTSIVVHLCRFLCLTGTTVVWVCTNTCTLQLCSVMTSIHDSMQSSAVTCLVLHICFVLQFVKVHRCNLVEGNLHVALNAFLYGLNYKKTICFSIISIKNCPDITSINCIYFNCREFICINPSILNIQSNLPSDNSWFPIILKHFDCIIVCLCSVVGHN